MMRSMFAGVSGLRSHQMMMDVVGDNIANVNTTGFKSSRVVFQDTIAQLLRGGTPGDEAMGGINPMQVGLGVRVGAIDVVNTQGAIQNTGRTTDVAIQGEGFFVVRSGQENLYTRAGAFSFDSSGRLVDSSGMVVQGWSADPNGAVNTTGPAGDISIPLGQAIAPRMTENAVLGGNLPASAAVGDVFSTAMDIYDGIGEARRVTFTYTKTAANAWTIGGSTGTPPVALAVAAGSANITFAPDGTISNPTAANMPQFTVPAAGGANAFTFTAQLGAAGETSALTQFGGEPSLTVVSQDGTPPGTLRSFSIADDGTISGVFSNGESKSLGQLAMASFTNPAGLVKAGQSHLRASTASGVPDIGEPASAGKGSLAAGALEMSNVELAQEFTNLIIAQRGFQANSRIISSSDELLQDLVNIKR